MWSKEWPTVAGYYWLYGQRYDGDEIRCHLVEVWESSGSIIYSTELMLIHEHEGAGGIWTLVEFPDLPKS